MFGAKTKRLPKNTRHLLIQIKYNESVHVIWKMIDGDNQIPKNKFLASRLWNLLFGICNFWVLALPGDDHPLGMIITATGNTDNINTVGHG